MGWRASEADHTPFLDSTLPQEVRQALEAGELMAVSVSMPLEPGETCYYSEPAIYEKKIRGPRSAKPKRGGLFRPAATTKSESSGVMDIAFRQVHGVLYITGSRVVFVGEEEQWSEPIDSLLSVKPYLNCVKLQFGKNLYKVFVPEGSLAHAALAQLREGV